MTETPYAIAHNYPLMAPAPDGVDDAISAVMAIHETELDEALRPFGVALSDLLQPTWMRVVRVGDVEPIRSPSQAAADAARGAFEEGLTAAAPAVDGVYVTDQLRDVESFGERIEDPELRGEALTFTEYVDGTSEGDERTALPLVDGGCSSASCGPACTCGPGMACSSPRCSGTPLPSDEAGEVNVADLPVHRAGEGGRVINFEPGAIQINETATTSGGQVDLLGSLRARVEAAQALQREADANGWGRRNV